MAPAELPPISNPALYYYRVFAKWLSFFVFGLGSIIITTLFLPSMRLVLHPKERFSKYARRLISISFTIFVNFMHFIRVLDLEVDNRNFFRNLKSKIIVANHPSILDIVMLISLIPNADSIVAGYLNRSIVRVIVRQLYSLSSEDFGTILENCNKSLKQGNCLVIFPEGTRTPRYGKNTIKKGFARISLASGCSIIPLHIGGTDKYGIGKKDPWTAYNPRERYVYRITTGNEINPEKYKNLPPPAAVRSMVEELSAFIFPN